MNFGSLFGRLKIGVVAAPCSSTAAAIEEAIPEIRPMAPQARAASSLPRRAAIPILG